MPAPAIGTPTGEPATPRREAEHFWNQLTNPRTTLLNRVLHEDAPFVQWLLVNPLYGPQHDAPKCFTGSLRAVQTRTPKIDHPLYKKGDIRPTGMSYNRALQIAIAAGNNSA